MRPIAGGILALVLALPAVRAEDKDKPAEPAADKDKDKQKAATPAEQFKSLVHEYNDAQRAFFKAYGEAKTAEEKQKVFQEKYPRAEKFAPRFLELAEKNPKDPAAVDALVWVASNVRQRGANSPRAKALEILGRDHLGSDKVAGVCDSLVADRDPASEALLRKLMEKSPSKDVQGRACLALGTSLKHRSQAKEAEEVLDRAATTYADVKHPFYGTVGKKAKGELFEIRFLAVGKEAPDVAGEDQDGKPFKLSEYRGKVVLLDFWGNW
jgi:hypothetical protein